jgi:ABC-2 type transport system ATP-binding protein
VAQGTLDDVRHKLQNEQAVTIIVKASGPLPKFADPRIIDASYSNGSAVIHAKEPMIKTRSVFEFMEVFL